MIEGGPPISGLWCEQNQFTENDLRTVNSIQNPASAGEAISILFRLPAE